MPEKPAERRPERSAGGARFSCPVAKRCGGCQLGGMRYREQLEKKHALVSGLLEGICPVEPVLGMEDPFYYRNKVHAVFAVDKRGDPISGVYEAGTHHVVPVSGCLIEDRRAGRIIREIVDMLPRYKLRIYNEYTHRGFLRHVVIRTGGVTGQIMVILVTTAREFPGGRAFTEELLRRCPEITTLVQNINQRETSMVLGRQDYVLFGNGWMEDELCGKRFRISPQSFYQVNARQCEVLYRTAIDLADLKGTESVLDAYCGTGTIGLCASDRIARLTGVELNREAVKDARINAEINGVKNAEFICGDAGEFMVKAARAGHAPDVVIMDPPRAGSDEKFLRSLLTMAPKKVVYVSCNPETLARDLRFLVKDGAYRAVKAIPVDMFPNTEHVETVALLSQQKPDEMI